MSDQTPAIGAGDPFTVILWGSVRGKVVASIAHAYALTAMKLTLPPSSDNAPWRIAGKPQDYFKWRKAMVEENHMLQHTLNNLFAGQAPLPGKIEWPRANGTAQYVPELANGIAQDYAKLMVKTLGLMHE